MTPSRATLPRSEPSPWRPGEIHTTVYSSDPRSRRLSKRPTPLRCLRAASRATHFLVVQDEDRIIAFANAVNALDRLNLAAIYALPDRRSQGAGTMLLAALRSRFPDLPVAADVVSGNVKGEASTSAADSSRARPSRSSCSVRRFSNAAGGSAHLPLRLPAQPRRPAIIQPATSPRRRTRSRVVCALKGQHRLARPDRVSAPTGHELRSPPANQPHTISYTPTLPPGRPRAIGSRLGRADASVGRPVPSRRAEQHALRSVASTVPGVTLRRSLTASGSTSEASASRLLRRSGSASGGRPTRDGSRDESLHRAGTWPVRRKQVRTVPT